MNDISLDIEACGEVVLSIGACEFDRSTGTIGREFYVVPSIAEQLAAGLKIDGPALLWWFKQADAARAAITDPEQVPCVDAIRMFRDWFLSGRTLNTRGDLPAVKDDVILWAYPTSYDLPIVAKFCHTFGLRPPWRWTSTMDARTLWKLALMVDPDLKRVETEATVEHHALEDAKQQAKWIVAYLHAVKRVWP